MVFRYYSVFKVHPHLSGDYSEKVTPVPIPNTVVKFLCADDTIWVTVWKSRSLPVYGPVVKRLRHRPFTAVTRVQFPAGSPFFKREVKPLFFYCVVLSKVFSLNFAYKAPL